jgi:hypothetical protein
MMVFYPGEEVRDYPVHESLKLKYAVTNMGRLLSYTTSFKEGKELRGSYIDGYKIFRYVIYEDGKKRFKHKFYYKMVAEAFLNKDSEDQTYVLHLDFVRDNDEIRNLKWASREQMLAHSKTSPHVKAAQEAFIARNSDQTKDGPKLTATKVMRIKKMLQDPERKTRKKLIAKQFNISQTHLKRIETGENWGYIKV